MYESFAFTANLIKTILGLVLSLVVTFFTVIVAIYSVEKYKGLHKERFPAWLRRHYKAGTLWLLAGLIVFYALVINLFFK